MISSAFLFGGLLSSLGASYISNQYGRRAALQISSGLVLLGSIALSIAPDLKWALFARYATTQRGSDSRYHADIHHLIISDYVWGEVVVLQQSSHRYIWAKQPHLPTRIAWE